MQKSECGCLYEGAVQMCSTHAAAPELLAIVKAVYDGENDVTRRKHSDELRFRMEEAITRAEVSNA